MISIWILNGNLFAEKEAYHLRFSLYDRGNRLFLTDHLGIHILQLPKWDSGKGVKSEKERWLYLFKEGKYADTENPPEILNTEEMRQAMNVLRKFSENETDYLLYQSRLDAILTQNTWLRQIEDAQKKERQAQKEKELAEERLRKLLLLLKEKGIDSEDMVKSLD